MIDQQDDNRGIPTTALVVISILLSMLLLMAILSRAAIQNLQMN